MVDERGRATIEITVIKNLSSSLPPQRVTDNSHPKR